MKLLGTGTEAAMENACPVSMLTDLLLEKDRFQAIGRILAALGLPLLCAFGAVKFGFTSQTNRKKGGTAKIRIML